MGGTTLSSRELVVERNRIKEQAAHYEKEDYWRDVESIAREIDTSDYSTEEATQALDLLVGAHERITSIEGCLKTLEHSGFPCAAVFGDEGADKLDFRYGIPWSDFAFHAFRKDIMKRLKELGI